MASLIAFCHCPRQYAPPIDGGKLFFLRGIRNVFDDGMGGRQGLSWNIELHESSLLRRFTL
jgi:hypothetical protein